MVFENGWGNVDPTIQEGFDSLGSREQNAANIALNGIESWRTTFEEPKPMRVRVTPENGFDLRGFANFMHTLKVGIAQSLVVEEGVVTFQPTPYSEEFHASIVQGKSEKLSRQANERAFGVSDEISDLEQLLNYLRKERQNP